MLGQIIYNVEDYAGTGGVISTALEDGKNYTEDYFLDNKKTKVNIFTSNIFKQWGASNITKVGIQAPPGTKFAFSTRTTNDDEIQGPQIMIGQSGIYELDGIQLDGLTFFRPKGYALDVEASNQLIHDGKGIMSSAKEEFDLTYESLKKLYSSASNSNSNKIFWEEYEKNHKAYISQYNLGRSMYLQGLSGVYITEDSERDLQNVIIDFVYTTEVQEVN